MLYTRRTLTKDTAAALVKKYGTQSKAARAILPNCVNVEGHPAQLDQVRQWIQNALAGTISKPIEHREIHEPARADIVNQVANLLEEANIPIEAIEKFENTKLRSGFHEVVTRGPKNVSYVDGQKVVTQGEPIVTRARSKGVTILLEPKYKGPAWPLVAQAKPTVIKYAAPTIIIPKGLRVEVIHPDTQIGYQRDLDSRHFDAQTKKETYHLEPIHDEAAIEVALQLTAAIQPDGFTHVGDLLDLSEFSKYLQVEEFWRTTQASIEYGHQYLAKAKSAIGEARKGKKKRLRIVDGNHDWRRLAVYVQQNARAAFGLRPANSTPDTWPDLSFPHLLRLDELGYETCGMWPGSAAWLVEGKNALVVCHDPKRLGYFEGSVICGHTHHHREEAKSVNGPGGERIFTRYEIGCLCSLKTVRNQGSIQRTKVPSDRGFVKDWAQGITVVEILESTGQHRVEFIPIVDGVALYQRQEFRAKSCAA